MEFRQIANYFAYLMLFGLSVAVGYSCDNSGSTLAVIPPSKGLQPQVEDFLTGRDFGNAPGFDTPKKEAGRDGGRFPVNANPEFQTFNYPQRINVTERMLGRARSSLSTVSSTFPSI